VVISINCHTRGLHGQKLALYEMNGKWAKHFCAYNLQITHDAEKKLHSNEEVKL